MIAKVKLGRIWGIPLQLDPSWFLIFGLLTWSLAGSVFPAAYSDLSTEFYWLLGGLTSLLFFGSVLAHELAHAFFAIRNRIPVRSITLFFFGGVAQIEREPRSAGAEFRVAIAGPLASLGLGLLFGGLGAFNPGIPYMTAPSLWLARVNLTLALFNLIPGFPLDGGRVLRALIWRVTGDLRRATQIAARTGQLVATGMIGLGVFTMFTSNPFDGLWLVFIGWFLKNAASSSRTRVDLEHSLRGVTVGQVMNRDCPSVSNLLPLSQLVEQHVMHGGHSCFFVIQDNELEGFLTLRDITRIPQRKWRFLTAGEAMVPLERLIRVETDVEIIQALQMMDAANVAEVRVVENDKTVGAFSREQVWHYLRLRAELGS